MEFSNYRSNEEGVGGRLEFNNSARETLRTIQSYDSPDVGPNNSLKLSGECHYFDEKGNEIERNEFLEKYLPRKDGEVLADGPCDSFTLIIDQSNEPQKILIKPDISTGGKLKKIILRMAKRAVGLLPKEGGKKAA